MQLSTQRRIGRLRKYFISINNQQQKTINYTSAFPTHMVLSYPICTDVSMLEQSHQYLLFSKLEKKLQTMLCLHF